MIWQPAGRRWYCQVCHRAEAAFEYRELPDTAPAIEQQGEPADQPEPPRHA